MLPLSSKGPEESSGVRFRSRRVDSRSIQVPFSAQEAFRPIRQIGGERGWYYANWLWRVRGWIDLLLGGEGLHQGRQDPEKLSVGDRVDCWRVESFEENRLLRLAAEMKVPGRAWLEFEVEDHGTYATIRQTALFDPAGLLGWAYWYALYPAHHFVFGGMLKGIAKALKEKKSQEVEEVFP